MLTSCVLLALAATCMDAATTAAPLQPAPSEAACDHGKLAWFSGTFEQALAEAKAKNRVVFIDFWTEW